MPMTNFVSKKPSVYKGCVDSTFCCVVLFLANLLIVSGMSKMTTFLGNITFLFYTLLMEQDIIMAHQC